MAIVLSEDLSAPHGVDPYSLGCCHSLSQQIDRQVVLVFADTPHTRQLEDVV